MTGACGWECAGTGDGGDTGDPGDDPAGDALGPGGPECRRGFPRCCGNIPGPEEACPDLLFRALNAVDLISSPDLDWKNSSGFPWETFGSEMEVFD